MMIVFEKKKIKYSLLAITDNSAVLSSYTDTVHNARSILFRRLNNVWYKQVHFLIGIPYLEELLVVIWTETSKWTFTIWKKEP